MTTTGEMLDRLERHYIKPGGTPGGIFVRECGLNAGHTSVRRIDALHVGFTSTSGRLLTGHEIKVSRADWLHELGQLNKATTWADQCHRWYLVTPTEDIVHDDELPHGWGHLVIDPRTRTRLRTVVKPTIYEDRDPSWLITRSILARLDTLQRQALADEAHTRLDLVREQVDQQVSERVELAGKAAHREAYAALEVVTQLEDELGVDIVCFTRERPRLSPGRVRRLLELDASLQLAEGWRGLAGLEESARVVTEAAAAAREALAGLGAGERRPVAVEGAA